MEEALKSIKEEEALINLHYADLKDYNLVNNKNVTFFPLQALLLKNAGTRDRDVMNENAVITWEGDTIKTISFQKRNSILGTYTINRRRLQYNAKAAPSESPVEIISSEIEEFSRPKFVSYRFPPSDEPLRDRSETIIVDGNEKNVRVIFIRDVRTRIQIIRDLRDQIIQLNMRIQIHLDNIKKRELIEAKKALNRK